MNKITYLKNSLFTILLFFTISLSAQSEAKEPVDLVLVKSAPHISWIQRSESSENVFQGEKFKYDLVKNNEQVVPATALSLTSCSYNVILLSGKSEEVAIPCDFPVKANTGNNKQDEENYNVVFLQWIEMNSEAIGSYLIPKNATGAKSVTIEIPQKEFNQFSEERQNSIREDSELYIIIK
jgi:hypothetical protein